MTEINGASQRVIQIEVAGGTNEYSDVLYALTESGQMFKLILIVGENTFYGWQAIPAIPYDLLSKEAV